MAQLPPSLAYHTDTGQDTRHAGRSVAVWTAIACMVTAVFLTLLMYNGRSGSSWPFAPAMRTGAVAPSQPWWVWVPQWSMWLVHAASLGVLVTGIGLIIAGRVFRLWLVGFVIALAISRIGYLSGHMYNVYSELTGFKSQWDARIITAVISTCINWVREMPILALAAVLLTRPWVKEAFGGRPAEATEAGVPLVGVAGIITGLLGVVAAGISLSQMFNPFPKNRSNPYSSYGQPPPAETLDLTWQSIFATVLGACCVAAVVAGIGLLLRQRWAVRVMKWQAGIAVIVNVVCVFLAIALYIMLKTGQGEHLIPSAVIRVVSIAIDVSIFLYLSDRRTVELLNSWDPWSLPPPLPREMHGATSR